MLDRAILRPGRFDRLIEVPKPNAEGREIIFEIHTRGMNVADDVEFAQLAEDAEEASGADIKAVCTEAGMFAIRDDRTEIRMEDFHNAWDKVQADPTRLKRRSRRRSPEIALESVSFLFFVFVCLSNGARVNGSGWSKVAWTRVYR